MPLAIFNESCQEPAGLFLNRSLLSSVVSVPIVSTVNIFYILSSIPFKANLPIVNNKKPPSLAAKSVIMVFVLIKPTYNSGSRI